MDGQSFDETVADHNLDAIWIKKVNAKKEDENKAIVKNISDKLLKESLI